MYCTTNFPTKKALKDAATLRLKWVVAATSTRRRRFPNGEPDRITFFQPNNIFNVRPTNNGVETIEGPHNPKPHTWYARCTIVDGEVVKIT